jgi:hypothetical protein
MKKFNNFHREMHDGAVLVRNHIEKYRPILQKPKEPTETVDRDLHLTSLYIRMSAWIMSVARLNSAGDLQAIACSCRSLLECAVDMTLLADDMTNKSGEKMRWWDLSARYQMAIAFVQLQNEIGERKKPPDVTVAQEFIGRNREFVESLRTNLWPQWKERNGRRRHPPRWTGNNDLRGDILEADRTAFQELIHDNLNQTLFSYYGSEYQRLNKTIHGSGILGVEGSAQLISTRAAFGCWAAASLAMMCHQIICIDRGLDQGIGELRNEWMHIRKVRMTAFVYHMQEIQDESFSPF